MFEKLPRTKVFRDPIYGYVRVDYKIISDLIDTLEFQRLRRIRQLSGVSMVFHTAEHSRFTHSLGTYEMARLILQDVDGAMENMSEYEQVVFLTTALLHDLGHGPYSHAFESVMSISHEEISALIIESPITGINKVLCKYSKNLPADVANVIRHNGAFPLIESLTSSQLDVDRMDYLTRDAYMTGATYGTIDRCRLLRSMIIKDKKVYFKASGCHSIESYIMSRYHMYWQVYYHPIARAYDLLLRSIYKRIYDLTKEGKSVDASIDALVAVINNNKDIESYVKLDDYFVNGMVKQLTESTDYVLKTLANALENRHLYNFININSPQTEAQAFIIKEKYESDPIMHEYFYDEVSMSQAAYLHSNTVKEYDLNDIKIILPTDEIMSLEDYSPIIKSLVSSSLKHTTYIFYFEVDND